MHKKIALVIPVSFGVHPLSEKQPTAPLGSPGSELPLAELPLRMPGSAADPVTQVPPGNLGKPDSGVSHSQVPTGLPSE